MVVLVTCHLSPVTADEPQLFVGTAKLELIPPGAPPLAGYSRRRGRPSTGIHDTPFVRAIVLQDHGTTVALVSCDLLIIDERLVEAVHTRLGTPPSRQPASLVVAATHTHSGPGAYGQKFLEKLSMGHFDPAVFDFLATRIAQAIAMAATHLQPVTLRHATTATEGLVVNRMGREVVDAELTVLSLDDERRNPVAFLVNFSAHPTTLGSWNRQLSADYPGALTSALEQRYPGATCLFLAGAVGDQAPVKHGERFEPSRWLGEQLAARVTASLDGAHQGQASTIRVIQRTVGLPPAHLQLGRLQLPSWLSQPLVDDDAALSLLAVDHALFIGVPCDLSAELGLELKAHARALGYQPLLVGFANDYIGYCLPERLYRTISYEASLAFNGPTTGSMLVEELKRMMEELAISNQRSAISEQ